MSEPYLLLALARKKRETTSRARARAQIDSTIDNPLLLY